MSPGEESDGVLNEESDEPTSNPNPTATSNPNPHQTPTPRDLQWALARVGHGYGTYTNGRWAERPVPVLPAGRTVTTGGVFTKIQSDGGLLIRPDRGSRGMAE